MKTVKPDPTRSSGKKEQVEQMFDDISSRYDLLNRILSFGIDRSWRKKAIRSLKEIQPRRILDIATGTADLAIASLKIHPESVTGLDLSAKMLEVGQAKLNRLGLTDKIRLVKGDSEKLPFSDNSFDAITVAFGVRNFGNLEAGLSQMHRVLRSGGKVAILEFSKPVAFPFRQLYGLYFTYLLPVLGGAISKNRAAYTYLPESVKHFPEGSAFCAYLQKAGFKEVKAKSLTGGICTLYTGIK